MRRSFFGSGFGLFLLLSITLAHAADFVVPNAAVCFISFSETSSDVQIRSSCDGAKAVDLPRLNKSTKDLAQEISGYLSLFARKQLRAVSCQSIANYPGSFDSGLTYTCTLNRVM